MFFSLPARQRIHATLALISTAVGLALPLGAQAQAASVYPNKPIRLIIPYPPGGATDVIGRIVGQRLGEAIGSQVVIENRGGAGGNIGAAEVARITVPTLVMWGREDSLIPYEAAAWFMRHLPDARLVAVVNPSLPIQSLKELVDYAKKHPGKLNFASSGPGAPQRMAMELFKQIAGVDIVHVAYRGSGPAMTDLVGGQVESMTETVPAALSFIKSNQLRPLAVLTQERISMLPDVPTAREQGYSGFNVSSLFGVMAPAGTPSAILGKLNGVLTAALSRDEVKAQLLKQGVYAAPLDIEGSKKRLNAEIEQWAKVIRDGKITLN